MQFRSNDVQGIFVYDFTDTTGWSEKVKEYYNNGDIIDVDFDVVIETHFTSDFLNGKFTAIDTEAQGWAEPFLAMMRPQVEAVEELAVA